jgi:hypothetical protein
MKIHWTKKHVGEFERGESFPYHRRKDWVNEEEAVWPQDFERIDVTGYVITEQRNGMYTLGRREETGNYDEFRSYTETVQKNIMQLSGAKALAIEDMNRLLREDKEREKAGERAAIEAEEATIASMSPFNRLFHDKGEVVRGYGLERVMTLELGDGTFLSIVAGNEQYSSPVGTEPPFANVEVGFPTRTVEELLPYQAEPGDPRRVVYKYVPVSVMEQIMQRYGVAQAGLFPYERVGNPAPEPHLVKLKTKLLR